MTSNMIYQFKITLKYIKPSIWRRIQVPQIYNFWGLHVAIQDSMGWFDRHLHMFRIKNPGTNKIDIIGIPEKDYSDDKSHILPGWELLISHYFNKIGMKSDYEYDFGDSWIHEIVLENILNKDPKQKYPICVAGERACPPEDCGGIGGYSQIIKTISNPNHKNFQDTMNWLGSEYNSESFDPTQVRFDNPQKRWNKAFRE